MKILLVLVIVIISGYAVLEMLKLLYSFAVKIILPLAFISLMFVFGIIYFSPKSQNINNSSPNLSIETQAHHPQKDDTQGYGKKNVLKELVDRNGDKYILVQENDQEYLIQVKPPGEGHEVDETILTANTISI